MKKNNRKSSYQIFVDNLKDVQNSISKNFYDYVSKKISIQKYDEESDILFAEKRKLIANIENV